MIKAYYRALSDIAEANYMRHGKKQKARLINGRLRTYYVSLHRTKNGVRFGKLIRLLSRLS